MLSFQKKKENGDGYVWRSGFKQIESQTLKRGALSSGEDVLSIVSCKHLKEVDEWIPGPLLSRSLTK